MSWISATFPTRPERAHDMGFVGILRPEPGLKTRGPSWTEMPDVAHSGNWMTAKGPPFETPPGAFPGPSGRVRMEAA